MPEGWPSATKRHDRSWTAAELILQSLQSGLDNVQAGACSASPGPTVRRAPQPEEVTRSLGRIMERSIVRLDINPRGPDVRAVIG
jgi:ferric-dicitrate binding protein FerR (iron transport regulator)